MHGIRESLARIIEDLVYETTLVQWGLVNKWRKKPWGYAVLVLGALLMLWFSFYSIYFLLCILWAIASIAQKYSSS